MCLTPNKKVIEKVKKRLEKGWILGYKVIEKQGVAHTSHKKLVSFIWYYEWKPGFNIANDRKTKTKGGCFHVFINRKCAEKLAKRNNKDPLANLRNNRYVVVSLLCKKKDFLSAGYDNNGDVETATFREVTLSKRQYNKALS